MPSEPVRGALAEACASGDLRRSLEALRDVLAVALEAADTNVKANISGQLRATLTQLAELGKGERKSTVDAILDEPAAGATNVVPLAERWGGKPKARKSAAPRRNSRTGT
jgi:hypothetical protein